MPGGSKIASQRVHGGFRSMRRRYHDHAGHRLKSAA
jgi:hypothetical protein